MFVAVPNGSDVCSVGSQMGVKVLLTFPNQNAAFFFQPWTRIQSEKLEARVGDLRPTGEGWVPLNCHYHISRDVCYGLGREGGVPVEFPAPFYFCLCRVRNGLEAPLVLIEARLVES